MITSEIPAGLENYYEPTQEGQYRLKVEDAVPVSEVETLKQKNKEFRDNNIALLKDNEKYKSFSSLVGNENLSPDKFQQTIENLATTKANSLVEEMRKKFEEKERDYSEKISKTTGRLTELTLGQEVTKAATEHGVLSSALEDVMFRAKNAFMVEDGEVKFKEQKLDANGKPYTVTGWMQEMKSKAPHLFAPSQGTGAVKPKGTAARFNDNRTAAERIASGLSQSTGSFKRLT